MSGFVYNFPHCSCASPYLLNQAGKIAEEAREVVCAARFYKAHDQDAFDAREQARLVNKIAMETMDVIHAAETMLRMLDGLVDVDGLRDEVIRKNRQRGYYEEGE
jgi:negative regulator of sigma E activity